MDSQDEKYLDLLVIFHYIVGAILALFSCFPLIHIAMGLAMVFGQFDDNGSQPPAFIGWMFVIMGSMFILAGWCVAVLVVIAGRKLQKRKHRMFCMVVAGIECMFMPFGTVLGVFTLVMLLKDSVKAMFDQPSVV